jgi:plastocyanin
MSIKNISIAVIALLVLIGGYFLFIRDTQTQNNTMGTAELGEPAFTIVRTESGYEPKEITVKKGDIVAWTNESGEFHWPASDLHPTHGVYPEFDPLKPIAPGDVWKFKFDKVGVWKFHDHIRANKVGTVTVFE